MKNLKYFPFERNNYYYGKLLTDKDFIKEQQYFNNKRRLHNRFFHGFGVVAGLNIHMIDKHTLSVEDGLAIDFSGREILVNEPMLYKLSMISGFKQLSEENEADYVYLCMEYNEDEKDFTQSIVSNQNSESFESNIENFHLYLTNKAPENYQYGAENLNIVKYVLFENELLRITQEFHKTIPSGEQFEVKFIILNKGNASNFNITIDEILEGAYINSEARVKVQFKKLFLERGKSTEKIVKLRAKKLDIGTINFTLSPENMTILVNGKNYAMPDKKVIEVDVSHGNVLEVLKKDYFSNIMEDIVTNNFGGGIYLAKIFLVRKNESFFIDTIEPMPANQYNYSTALLTSMVKELERNMLRLQENIKTSTQIEEAPKVDLAKHKEEVQHGVVEIPLTFPSKAGQVQFSKKVFHNLGEGPFIVDYRVQEKNMLYSGQAGIFKNRSIKAQFEIEQDIKKASFTFGVKLLENTNENSVIIRYSVRKEETEILSQQKKLYIVPSKLELKVRETHYLEAISDAQDTILWSVVGKKHGSISKDGLYTAPNKTGVYEIVACLEKSPDIKASLFVVVRE